MKSEEGTIAPLAIGLSMISLATILTLQSASSLFVFERRLQTVADLAVLKLKYDTEYSKEIAELLVMKLSAESPKQFQNISVQDLEISDGKTLELTTCADWKNPLPVIALKQKRLCVKASAR